MTAREALVRIALVQCPAWGILPPLGAATLKSYLDAEGFQTQCFDLNVEFFHEEQRVLAADSSGAYGGLDPWGAESYDQWGLEVDQRVVEPGEVRFLEGSMYNERPLPVERWADQILEWEPDVVGFSVYITSLASSLLLARELQARSPETVVVFGGPHVAQDQSGDVALRTGIPDAVVDGEGEVTFTEIIRAVESGNRDLGQIDGVGTLVGGRPNWAPTRPLIPKIDPLPFPDFSDFDWSQYENPLLIPIMSSRGCVLDCAFCYETVYWRRYRTMSPQRIVDEMAYQVERHPYRERAAADGDHFYFMFADSLVNGHLGGLRRMADLLIERDLDVRWGGQATINTKMDVAFFDKLSRAGCTGLAFGLESGSQQVLDSMGKHFHIDDAARFIQQAHEAGVTVTANIMVGYPNETFRDFLHTLRFVTKTRKWLYQVSNVTTTQIALGSELHAHPEQYGVTVHADGSWTSDETGDEYSRARRLRILHVWMTLMRVPHQEIAPAHRAKELRRSHRRERRARLAERWLPWRSAPEEPAAPAVEVEESTGWLPFSALGSGPRDDAPARYLPGEPFAELLIDDDGVVTVESFRPTPLVPVEREQLDGGDMGVLAEAIQGAFGDDLQLDWPDPEDHEQLLVHAERADGATFQASAVPRRGDDGRLLGARFALWAESNSQPVTLTVRSAR
jgi:anaerobic magnesium-protoporphyrin IX monomethyl ester cyclase